jgi:hypothetical protein
METASGEKKQSAKLVSIASNNMATKLAGQAVAFHICDAGRRTTPSDINYCIILLSAK